MNRLIASTPDVPITLPRPLTWTRPDLMVGAGLQLEDESSEDLRASRQTPSRSRFIRLRTRPRGGRFVTHSMAQDASLRHLARLGVLDHQVAGSPEEPDFYWDVLTCVLRQLRPGGDVTSTSYGLRRLEGGPELEPPTTFARTFPLLQGSRHERKTASAVRAIAAHAESSRQPDPDNLARRLRRRPRFFPRRDPAPPPAGYGHMSTEPRVQPFQNHPSTSGRTEHPSN